MRKRSRNECAPPIEIEFAGAAGIRSAIALISVMAPALDLDNKFSRLLRQVSVKERTQRTRLRPDVAVSWLYMPWRGRAKQGWVASG